MCVFLCISISREEELVTNFPFRFHLFPSSSIDIYDEKTHDANI